MSFVGALMFGQSGAARIAFSEWLIDQRLRGMHRTGKSPGAAFSDDTRKTWYAAEHKHRSWPHTRDHNGESYLVEIPAEQGKLPQGVEELMRESWKRHLRPGTHHAYTGMRPLRKGQSYEMIEDMVCVLLEDEGRPKMYRSPLSKSQQLRYNQIIEDANRRGIEPFSAVYGNLFDRPDALRPVWNKARRILYEYSGTRREAAMEAGFVERPDSIGVTWRESHNAWQAQIAYKGRQKYLGLFKNKVDAQSAYYRAAAKMGHIPGLPDIDKIWPTWKQEKARLALMRERPRMPIIYQQQDTHEERKHGLRPPEAMRELVGQMKKVDWLVRHCILVFDDDRPPASPDIAITSRGKRWYEEMRGQGKRCVIQGCTSIDRDTGRIRITVYCPGFDSDHVLAEEIYHIVFGIIQKTKPKTFRAVQRWYESSLRNGTDPTVRPDEAFSKSICSWGRYADGSFKGHGASFYL